MSRVEEGNLFFKRFGRTALALSAVTSSFVLANTGVIAGVNSGGTSLTEGETNSSIGLGIASGATAVDVNTSISGAIVAGATNDVTSGNPAVTTRSFLDANGSAGVAVGLDINATGVTNITNSGSITATAETLSSFDPNSANADDTKYPDVNNTEITAAAILVEDGNSVDSINNAGTITSTATLNNDTNNSKAGAVGLLVGANVAEGIVNIGSISATAIKTDIRDTNGAEAGGLERYTQATIGGHTGTLEEKNLDSVTGAENSTITTTISKAGIYAKDEAEVRASSEAGTTVEENDFKSTGSVTTIETSNVVNNTIAATGVIVDSAATVTGGLTDHNYISSVLNEGTLAGDTTNGSKNGLTVTPNQGAGVGDGTAPTDNGNVPLTDAEIAAKVATGETAGAAAVATATGNAGKKGKANVDADVATVQTAVETANAGATEAPADGVVDGQIATARTAAHATDADYQRAPTATEIATAVAAQKAAASAGTPTAPAAGTAGDPAEGITSGSFTARIGNVINNKDITGAAGGFGVEVRATTSSNVSDLLGDTGFGSDDNLSLTHTTDSEGAITGDNNANITSGTASAYLGEGSLDRVVTQDATGVVSNTLIGGLDNNKNIAGGLGKSAISLNAGSDINVNDDSNNSDALRLSVSDASLDINVDPSSTVAIGQLRNSADGTIAGALGGSGIEMLSSGSSAVKANNDANITGGKLVVTPNSLNSIGTLLNEGSITGGLGASGITMDAKSEASVETGLGLIKGGDVTVSPLVTNRIDLLINTDTIKGGLGGSAINGTSLASALVDSKDINDSSTINVAPIVNNTIGDLYNTGTISESLGDDAIKLISTSSSELKTDKVENSTVSIASESTGGVRIKGNASSTGNLVNGGTVSISLGANAINMDTTGKAQTVAASAGPSEGTTEFLTSTINVKDTSRAGIEGSFVNIATTMDENRTKTVGRGTVSAALAADAMTLEGTGETTLKVKKIEESTVNYAQTTTAGIGGNFDNGGTISVALAANGVDLSSTSTTTAFDNANTDINASTVTTSTTVRAGVGGDFINGAYALETGEEQNGTVKVDNATVSDGNGGTKLARPFVIAANVNENNSSDVNSTGTHTNNLLTDSSTIFYHDKETAITNGTISAALSADAVKFTTDATGDLKAKDIFASTTDRNRTINGTSTIFQTQERSSDVTSVTVSDASIKGNFINNGSITVALAARGVDGETKATGTLGDVGTSTIVGSKVTQTTTAIGGLVGDFRNEVVSREVDAATLYTENSGSTDNSSERALAVYARDLSAAPVISSALADDAVNLQTTSANAIAIKSTDASSAVVHQYGSGEDTGTTDKYAESVVTADAGDARATVSSTTNSTAGVGGNFSNTGTISVALAADGFDAQSTGNTNDIDTTSATTIKGSDVTATMTATAGVRGDFTNDVQSLDTGSATILYHDVYNTTSIDGTTYELSPKYYENADAEEGKRVKSNVIDTDAIVYDRTEIDGAKSADVRVDTAGFVYDKEVVKGEITAALAKSPIMLEATTTTTVKPLSIGTSDVDVITLHTGYTTGSDASIADSNRTVKVVSNVTESSTVTAGVGGKFTNKNVISSALASDAINVRGEATNTFGDEGVTVVTGGVHASDTKVISGIRGGFLNAADTYDTGTAQTGNTKIRTGRANDDAFQLVASTANDYLDDNATTKLNLQDSKTVAFWNKELVVSSISSALAKDSIKADGVATGTLTPNSILAATGVVDKNISGTIETFDVVGNYVNGTAKASITQNTATQAGIVGDFTNQGKITNALSAQVLNAESTAKGTVGHIGNTVVTGSVLDGTTKSSAGIQGDFRNEVVSLDLDNGEVYVDSNAYDADPKVAYDKTTTVGQVVMSTALSKENMNLRSNATSTIAIKASAASDAVKDSRSHADVPDGGVYDGTLATYKADALTAKSAVKSTSESQAGISGDFYNSGKITASLSKELIDGTTTGTNAITAASVFEGTDVTANVVSIGGIQGDFTNDVVSLDTGAKTLLAKDVYTTDSNGANVAPEYHVYHGNNLDNNITGGFTDAPIAADGTRVKSNVTDRVLYSKEVVESEISSSLSKESVKLNAIATDDFLVKTLGTSDVNVITINDGDHTKFDSNRTLKVTSDLTASTGVKAGIGGRLTNASKISNSLSKDVISANGSATSTFGDATTTVTGGHVTLDTTVIAGIGNDANTTNAAGFINLANTYDKTLVIDKSKVISGRNDAPHSLIATNNAHDANVDENTTSLNLIDSAEVALWDKTLVVGEISASLSKEVLNLDAVATSTIDTLKISSATSDANLTAKDALVAVEGNLVAGNARAKVNKTTTVTAGVNGGFVNQGKITSSLSKDVLNVNADATGIVGNIAQTEIVGADVTSLTQTKGGIFNGGFRNEVLSLDLDNGKVATQISASGVESPKAYFDKTTTIGQVEMSTATSGGSNVLFLDASAVNTVDAKAIKASGAILGNSGLTSALTAGSNVSGTTKAIAGIGGDFYNSALLKAALSDHVIKSSATSDNNLGSAAGTINGSTVTANALADARIRGNFVNDAKLLDTGAATIKYRLTADGNDSNVVDTITYDQEIAKGVIEVATAKDALQMIATGTNNIKLAEVGNSEVTVAQTNVNGYVTGASSDHNVSSNVTATNVAKSGITGTFVNAGEIKVATGENALNFQAVGGASTIEVDKIGGGSVTANNTVISGINLDGSASDIAFLNDKRDFNTVLSTDDNYDATKVATGLIDVATGKDAIKLVATGGAVSDIAPDTTIVTHGQDATYDVATVTNNSVNEAIINGHFVNKGEIKVATGDFALNMTATNEAKNDVDTGVVADSGILSSVTNTTVTAGINGNLTNSGLIQAATAKGAINLVADAAKSEAIGALADVNATEYAGRNNIKIVDSTSTTKSSILALSNTGTIEGSAGAKAIIVDAKGEADSSAFDLGSVVNSATNNVLVNNLSSTASIASIYNAGEIKTADATAIDVTATGSAKTSADGDATKASYETTTATVTASIGDITNDAFTTHNTKAEVDKAFNGGVQLHPTEEVVAANGGEYDFTSFNATNDTDALSQDTNHNLSTGTKVARTLDFNTTAELNALAYNDNNASDNPALSQTIGKITTGTGTAAISLVAVATESEFATVTASAGNVNNKGVIDGGTGKGIYLSATGDKTNGDAVATEGAKAYATMGQIYNASTHQTFESAKEGTLHTVINGEIKGDAGAIVLAAVGAADQNVSVTRVDQIVNARTVLETGSKVVSSASGDADGKVIANATDTGTVTNTATNYNVDTLTKDTAYLAVIGSGADKVAIDIGENAHVTNGIHNYGKISGQVKLGDADLHLYGLIETNTSKLSSSLFMSQAELASAAGFEQAAGIVDSTAGITDSFAGSSVVFEGAHLFNGATSGHQIPAIEADEIIIAQNSVVNIADDQAFDVTAATDIYNRGLKQTFVNKGFLNVAAGKKVDITGNYSQEGGKFYSNLIAANIAVDDNNTFASNYGQLNVTGNADLAGGIGVIVDSDARDLLAETTTETRLKDIVTAGTLSVSDINITHAGGNTKTALGVKVTDNVTAYDFQAVEGTDAGNVDLLIVKAAVEDSIGTGIVIDTPRVALETARAFSNIIDTRIDSVSGYSAKLENKLGSTIKSIERNAKDGENAGENVVVTFGQRVRNSLSDKNFWIKPFAAVSKQDSTNSIAGYNTTTYGLAAGADKEYKDWTVGTALVMAKGLASSTSGASSSTDTTLFQISEYGSTKMGDGIINLQAGFGYLTNDRTRRDDIENVDLKSDYNGYIVQAKAEYEEAYKMNKDTLLIPYGEFSLAHIANGAYSESGGTGALDVSSSSANSAILGVGSKVKYKLSDNSSVVGSLGLGYDFAADAVGYDATNIANGDSRHLTGNKVEKLEYNAGIAYQFETGAGTQIKVGVDYNGRNSYDSAIGSARFYFPF